MSELYNKLVANLPEESITKHPTKTYLSSIKAIYVTERLTTVFGVGKWRTRVKCENVNFDTGMVIVHVTFEVPELGIYYESFGGNDNGSVDNKNFDLGDAYKGATTDAITKIGSYLGIGIDVFKGTHNIRDKKLDALDPDGNEKKWVNIGDVLWIRALDKNMSLNDIRHYCKVSKANGIEYEKQLKAKND